MLGVTRLLILAGLAVFASPALAQSRLSLPDVGTGVNAETVASEAVAPGVRYSVIRKGNQLAKPTWFVSFGVARDPKHVAELQSCARRLGLSPRRLDFRWPGIGSLRYSEIIAGAFATREQVTHRMARRPLPGGCVGRVTASPLYPADVAGPWRIHVVEIDPRAFAGGWQVTHGNGLATGRHKTSDIARAQGAVVAINGGFFVMEPEDGIVGESAGLSITGGAVQSEPSNGRPWFVFPDPKAVTASLQTSIGDVTPRLVWSDGTVTPLDGVNREPGLLRNCGSLVDGAERTGWHDRTCHPADQLIVITADGGFVPHTDASQLIAALGADGIVRLSQDGAIRAGDMLLIATGRHRDELSRRIATGQSARLTVPLLDRFPKADAVSGGPTLIYGGKPAFDETREGWPFALATDAQANDMHRFVVLRAPRTAIGVRPDGTVLLVVIDGWRFADNRRSTVPLNGGATIDELRRIMLDLGADQAMNLDGGGSTTLAIDGKVVNQPSDVDGERAVGDAVLLIPAPRAK